MTPVKFNLTVPVAFDSVHHAFQLKKCFEGKIKHVLISVCSCLVGLRNHGESAAVNVNTALGRLCKGAGRSGEGYKRPVHVSTPTTHIQVTSQW